MYTKDKAIIGIEVTDATYTVKVGAMYYLIISIDSHIFPLTIVLNDAQERR